MAQADIIDGKAVAAEVRAGVRGDVEELVRAHGRAPGLATVLVGEDPASAIYIRRKREACEEAGITSFHHALAAEVGAEELRGLLLHLSADDAVDGILLQSPIPRHLDFDEMTALIEPGKDVDGLHPINAGLLLQDRPGLVPCTPLGVMELLRAAGTPLAGVRAAVIGRSNLVGKPVAQLLLAANATVTHCHSRTADLAETVRGAEVVVAAVGVPELISADMIGAGATVIDVGINRGPDGLVGDVDFTGARARARAITPVPGGVGPMTIAMLLRNTVIAARRAWGSGPVAAPGASGGQAESPGAVAG